MIGIFERQPDTEARNDPTELLAGELAGRPRRQAVGVTEAVRGLVHQLLDRLADLVGAHPSQDVAALDGLAVAQLGKDVDIVEIDVLFGDLRLRAYRGCGS